MSSALRRVGIISVAVASFAILPSLVSGAGALLALFALILGGISAINGERKHAWITMFLVTVDLAVLSVLPHLQNTSASLLALMVGAPYLFAFLCILFGLRRQDRGRKGSGDS